MKPYYEAYDLRYRQVHQQDQQWFSSQPTPIVGEMVRKYVPKGAKLLEIGCGEGRDALPLLRAGYALLATDLSPEAVAYCREKWPEYEENFAVLDCLGEELPGKYDFIYAVAVLHMLTEDEDRAKFLRFFRRQLAPGGRGLICAMGDGEEAFSTDPAAAFQPVSRRHSSGRTMTLAATSCRVVTRGHFLREISGAGLSVLEEGNCAAPPDFPQLLYALVEKQ